MKAQISAELVMMGAAVLLVGSATSETYAQRAGRVEVNATVQDNGQQAPPPQNPDDARQNDTRRPADDRDRRDDRRDERGSDAPQEGDRVTLRPDTIISVRIADEINSSKNHTGDIFTGVVDPSVLIHNQVVIPRGTEAHVRMAEDKKGGRIHGKAQVRLELVSLVVNGRRLEVESDPETREQGAAAAKGKAEAKSVEHLGSSTSVAGPAGSAAGPVIAAFSAAKVEVKPNTRVEFILAEPLTFVRPPVADATRPQ